MPAKKKRKAKKKHHSTAPVDMPQMPFDQAMRRLLGVPAKDRAKK